MPTLKPVAPRSRRLGINLRHIHIGRRRVAHIVLVVYALGQFHGGVRNVAIRKLAEQVVDAVEAGGFFVVGMHQPPRRFGDVGAL